MPKTKVSSPILGQRLRDIRKAKGVKSTQTLSGLMGGKYSYSNISRRETGELKIDFEFLTDFCNALNLSKAEEEELMTSARVNLLRPQSRLIESVSEWRSIAVSAKVYSVYTSGVFCYHLQDYNYARSVISAYGDLTDPERSAQARIRDADDFLSNKSKKFSLLCHENAIYFFVGSARVMITQLEKLLNFKDEPNLEFRILPRESTLPVPLNEGFEILDATYCICENRLDFSITDDPTTVARFQSDFNTLWAHAVIGVRRNEILERAIAYYKSLEASLPKVTAGRSAAVGKKKVGARAK